MQGNFKIFKNAIVSANYRDRSSPLKWLVRPAISSPAAAVACKSIEATGVKFVETPFGSGEMGFGCRIVAECECVIADLGTIEELKPLSFDWNRFVDLEGKEVAGCDRLILTGSGGMFAAGAPTEQQAKNVEG